MDYSKFFDQKIDRHHTNSVKWDMHEASHKPKEAYPLWVADMDFKVMPEIVEALNQEVNQSLYGYKFPDEKYFSNIISWLKRRHSYDVKKEWITTTPGVVSAINADRKSVV